MISLRFWGLIKEASNINLLWALLVIEEFTRLGVTHFFISPGSRSTPLVTAIARNKKANTFVHFDERGSAFAALGSAKLTGIPAVWVTTSGTAVANGLPAVIEAHMSGVPLILLTADRPPELRQTGANQSINQFPIFGSYLNWSFDAPTPTTEIAPAYLLTSINQAVQRAIADGGGPVHINWMFREPLAPITSGIDYSDYLSEINDWLDNENPYTKYTKVYKSAQIKESVVDETGTVWNAEKGVIIAGRLKNYKQGHLVKQLAATLRWPLVSDISSFLRLGADAENSDVLHISPLVFNASTARLLPTPDTVVQFGKLPTSKHVLSWINSVKPDNYMVIDDFPGRIDPLHRATHRLEADIEDLCNQLLSLAPLRESGNDQWLEEWRRINENANSVLINEERDNQDLTEPAVTRIVSAEIKQGHILVIGNSMPIRDFDSFSVFNGARVHTITNRGASGIDGIIATAIGASLAAQRPTTVVIGDLAMLHDLNSLAMANQLNTSFVIVVINNNGGGIFSFLPIAEFSDVFEPFFGVPHNLSFKEAARMFKGAYHNPSSQDAFKTCYAASIVTPGLSIIEVNTDRYTNAQLHKDIEKQVKVV